MASQKLSSDARLSWSAGLPGGSGGWPRGSQQAVRRNGLLGREKHKSDGEGKGKTGVLVWLHHVKEAHLGPIPDLGFGASAR